jgi:phage-related protein (TIGR01555 family)
MGNVVPLRRMADGLANMFSRLGTGADRNTQSFYSVPLVTQPQAEAAYRSSWLARKIHDLPPFEMTREGRDWQAQKEQIELLEATEKRIKLWPKIRQALTTARLHGGAALIVGVRTGGSADPSQPLDVTRVGKDGLRYAFVASKHQLSAPFGMETDPESDFFGQPAMYEIRGAKGQSLRVHPSRVFPFHGAPLLPGMVSLSALDAFWGDPLLVSIKSAIDNSETSQAAVAALLHEMKLDVISIPGLTEQLGTTEGEALIAKRVEAVNLLKSMFNALLLDGGEVDGQTGKAIGGETWETRQLSFAQHPELLRQFLGIVAGASDIPVTRLMGESPGGMNSTGKGEQDDFERMISAKQGAEITPVLTPLDEILLRSALGTRPPEVYWEYAPLRPVDATQASENEKREAETVSIIQTTGLVPSVALAKAAQNRMVESGRWPGLDKAIEEAEAAGKLPATIAGEEGTDVNGEPKPEPVLPAPGDDPAANDNPRARTQAAERLAKRGTVTRDHAIALIADATPRSLYVRRDLLNWAAVDAHYKAQGLTTTLAAAMHATVIHSRTPVDWLKVGESWGSDDGTVTIAPGGPRLHERFDKGAVVLLFVSGNMSYRNEDMKRAGAQSDHAEYQPHVTLTYALPDGVDWRTIEPYRGKLEFGPEIFEEVDDNWQSSIAEA